MAQDKKIQTFLSPEDERKLKMIVNAKGLYEDGKITVPRYVRELLEKHIKEVFGAEQKSMVSDRIKEIVQQLEIEKRNEHGRKPQ